ncbi:MAG: hypothetical protein K2M06_02640 [Muribaculaceae bacterium]|nr:hypothetical protein [Muribaculaceae bacterium]
MLRGPQKWAECAVGFAFQAGGEDEAFLDVVIDDADNFFVCARSHSKTALNGPSRKQSTSDPYWTPINSFDTVATKILLAHYALIKNLGVETVDMRDASGNIIFQVKDGDVTCRKGSFSNIDVSGKITAESLFLKLCENPALNNGLPDGSIYMGVNEITLPEVPEGFLQVVRVYNPAYGAIYHRNLKIRTTGPDVLVSTYFFDEPTWTELSYTGCGAGTGSFVEFFGFRHPASDKTWWLPKEIKQGLPKDNPN